MVLNKVQIFHFSNSDIAAKINCITKWTKTLPFIRGLYRIFFQLIPSSLIVINSYGLLKLSPFPPQNLHEVSSSQKNSPLLMDLHFNKSWVCLERKLQKDDFLVPWTTSLIQYFTSVKSKADFIGLE